MNKQDESIKAPEQPFRLNANNQPWPTEEEARNEMRVQGLSPDTWTVARAVQGDGFCLMTFKYIVEMQARRDRESLKVADKTPMKFFKISVHTTADPLKQDQISQPVVVNGELLMLFLNSKTIVKQPFLEALNNSLRPNMVPNKDGKEHDTTRIIGWRGRVNYSIDGEATEAEYRDYAAKNKDRFEKFQIERTREQPERQ